MTTSDLFGSMVFGERTMSERLPSDVFTRFKHCTREGKPLDVETANVIANAMKDWAVEKGVTHFTHWFQPMTGITAEKHDSFISPTPDGGVIMEFSGKELIKGEPDASSFPSGGLRATFEARGYTSWDPTSYAFIKDGILCIPTAFCSYNGEALDKKTPLLRSMEAIDKQATRLMKFFGRKTEHVSACVGSEQEYFLVDTKVFEKRKDLIFTGRTLFGARPPKGQELEDHYFGPIKPRIVAYMKDLDEELWKVGILSKTKHNEVAPAQHELAPIYTTVNVATDQNQLTMEIMKKVAAKHGMTCLLHEKPFAGVNGSGKHNNWSLVTNFGHNLFDPGKSPEESAQFLLIISAVIAAVDKHQDLIRISVASAGNDHRLGANEAPPAIVSMYLGDELTGILDAISEGRSFSRRAKCDVAVGVHVLPKFAMDSTDRNRTSPFAFTGNKFEFRMPGSAFSIAGINVVLNTILADEFMHISDELDKTDDVSACVHEIIKRNYSEHKRIVFNGNNYSSEWLTEAKKRGLLNLSSTMDCLPELSSKKNAELFDRQHVFTQTELNSRRDILIENYCKLVNIEAMTMTDMAEKDIIPAVSKYSDFVAGCATKLKALGIAATAETQRANKLSNIYGEITEAYDELDAALLKVHALGTDETAGRFYRDHIISCMRALRAVCDEAEMTVATDYWPFPVYSDLLFSINE